MVFNLKLKYTMGRNRRKVKRSKTSEYESLTDSSGANCSLSDSNSDSMDNYETIEFFSEPLDQLLQAKYLNKIYCVHYLDLYADEYAKLHSIYYTAEIENLILTIPKAHINIDKWNMLSVKRHFEDEHVIKNDAIGRVYFSIDSGFADLTIKYQNKYYTASDNLKKVHEDICKDLDITEGFCMCVKADLLDPNEEKRVLGIHLNMNGVKATPIKQVSKKVSNDHWDKEITRYLPQMLSEIDSQLIFNTEIFPETTVELSIVNGVIQRTSVSNGYILIY